MTSDRSQTAKIERWPFVFLATAISTLFLPEYAKTLLIVGFFGTLALALLAACAITGFSDDE